MASSAESALPPAPEVDPEAENDSALGEDADTDTSSLASTIMRHREEFGRTYHKFRGGENDYWGPNDETQNDQLDLGHHMLLLLLNNKLYLAPIDKQKCHQVLDVGCGTGLWALDFADAHPQAEVIGIDLSPIQPAWVPPNCQFIIDDAEDEWTFAPGRFDFVHIRCMYGSISRWSRLYKQAYTSLTPGGWIQNLEISIEFDSDDGTVAEDSVLKEWSRTFIEAGDKMGKTFKIANEAFDLVKDAGFVDVHQRWYKVPVGRWPKDKAMKQLGLYNQAYCLQGCEGWALFLLNKIMGWPAEQVQVFVATFRNALSDPKLHAYYKICVVWAKKPEVAKTAAAA